MDEKIKCLEDFVALGEKCGLSGTDLITFAKNELKEYHDQLRDRRAAAKDAAEAAAAERAAAIETTRIEAEAAERAAAMRYAHELELKKLEQVSKSPSEGTEKGIGAKFKFQPKPFNEKVDDLDTWFDCFERQASFCKIGDETKKLYLYDCFRGRFATALMSTKTDASYASIKATMLANFNLTSNDYRKRFFELKPEKDDTFAAYLQRIEATMDKWLDLSKCEENFFKLKKLLLMHKIYDSCNESFITHLLEHGTDNISDMEVQATAYFQAHTGAKLGKINDNYLGANAVYSDKNRFERKPSHDRDRGRSGSRQPWKGRYDNRFHDKYKPVEGKRNDDGKKKEDDKNKGVFCFKCLQLGHIKTNCTLSENDAKESKELLKNAPWVKSQKSDQRLPSSFAHPELVLKSGDTFSAGQSATKPWETKHVYSGLLKQNGKFRPASILRDTGSAVHAIHERFVEPSQYLTDTQKLITFGGSCETFRLAEIEVDTPFISGKIIACVLSNYPDNFRYYDVLIGNGGVLKSPVAKDPQPKIVESWIDDHVSCYPMNQVETRASSRSREESALNSLSIDFNLSHSEIINLQRNDDSLSKYYALLGKPVKETKKGKVLFELCNGVLVRVYQTDACVISQVLVPQSLRIKIMSLSHDSPCSGHMGIKRTLWRISNSFFWPGMSSDVRHFCRSCEACLKTRPKGRTMKAPLQTVPLISVPFTKCATDLIGPLPLTERRNLYILTLIDYASRWVEAVPLRTTTSTVIAEELLNIFSRIGIPKILVSDGGPQFTSSTMEEVLSIVGICHNVTSPYHPEANGLCERVNGTIKSMLRKLADDNPKSWDRLLQFVLFAYREVPQETTGFSPFALVYGREARGPVAVVKDLWLGKDVEPELQACHTYVGDLQKRIAHSCELACQRTESQAATSKKRYDKTSRPRSFCRGDQVLLLLPTSSNKLTSQWKGPYEIVEKCSEVEYKVEINGKVKQYHINTLQEFVPRFQEGKSETFKTSKDERLLEAERLLNCDDALPCQNTIGMVLENAEGSPLEKGKIDTIILPTAVQSETIADVIINRDLDKPSFYKVSQILDEFKDVFSDVPSKTKVITHEIHLKDKTPIYKRQYPLSFASEEIIRQEVEMMLSMDVIEKSDSPFSSPIVLVKKKDGKTRFCIDFRAVNCQTISLNVPIPDQDLLFSKLSEAQYFTKLDLCKGYWQIPLSAESRHITAFQAAGELYHFKMMCFGLKNAPGTFNRMMACLLGKRTDVVFFFDDVTIFHKEFNAHLSAIKEVLQILRDANLRVKPKKAEFCFGEIQFLGHVVGNSRLKPADDNTNKIINIEVPKTKKHVKSVMGLITYYSKFLPHLSTLMKPITRLVEKASPKQVIWTDECQRALSAVKSAISAQPSLKLPNLNHPFCVQTDASGTGLGGVLLQRDGDCWRPCAFVSRKLTPCEQRYAVIERECLAIYWAVHRLARYLLGRQFVLQTDHRPLQFLLEGRPSNCRLFRWALSLQQFDFTIEYIRGQDNILADFLSRY